MLKFDDSGLVVFDTSQGPVGLAWTPKGVNRLILGLDSETIATHLAPASANLPTVRRPRGDLAILVKRIKSVMNGKVDNFEDVPVSFAGMGDFSQTILKRLRKVKAPQVVTYGELAALCGKPKAARAVGRIMGANPVPLIVPCHRCLGKDGSMTGFSTEGGIELKARMLFREGYVANKSHAKGIKHLRRVDPVMRKIIDKIGPYRALPDKPQPAWDALLTAIVHQQLSIKAGVTIAGRVKNLSPGSGFPTPTEVINLTPQDLRSAGLSKQKVSYIKDLAVKVDENSLKLNSLKKMNDDEVIEELTKVRGIGPWSAQMHLIFHLGRLDVLPTGDLGIQIAAARFYGLDEYATVAQLETIGAKWAPYRSMGSWYLWQGLDSGGLA